MTNYSKTKNIVFGAIVTGFLSTSALALTTPVLTDLNGDGVISAEEIAELREQRKAALLTEFDTNGDGELSRDERATAKAARKAAVTEQFDADGDGKLSRQERRVARDAREDAIDAQLDVNQDGIISDEESAGFEAVRSEKRESRRGGHKHEKSSRGDKKKNEQSTEG